MLDKFISFSVLIKDNSFHNFYFMFSTFVPIASDGLAGCVTSRKLSGYFFFTIQLFISTTADIVTANIGELRTCVKLSRHLSAACIDVKSTN